MYSQGKERLSTTPPTIYIISGGVGASGEQLVETILAQFPDNRVPVIVKGNVRLDEQIEEIVRQAKEEGGTIIHTLVDVHLRKVLVDLASREDIFAIDLMGATINRITEITGQEPLGQPGLYRKLRKDYFERVAAIEYTTAHDDGKDPQGWPLAEIVLLGVSRTGKTPLSIYLSVLGWKVANVPIVPGVPVSSDLFSLDRRRVVGLSIEPGQLLIHRQQRQSRLGTPGPSPYTDPALVYEEIQSALKLFRENGFSIIDVTDKAIETSSDEVVKLITRQVR